MTKGVDYGVRPTGSCNESMIGWKYGLALIAAILEKNKYNVHLILASFNS